jgi:hypothetical protein
VVSKVCGRKGAYEKRARVVDAGAVRVGRNHFLDARR